MEFMANLIKSKAKFIFAEINKIWIFNNFRSKFVHRTVKQITLQLIINISK